MARGRKASEGDYVVSEKMSVTKDNKITSVESVLQIIDQCPDNYRCVRPSIGDFSEGELYHDMMIALAERVVAKRKEAKEDYLAGKTPEGKVKRNFAKTMKQIENIKETAKSLGLSIEDLKAAMG